MEAASLISHKTAIWFFVAKYAALSFIETRVCFGLLKSKFKLLWALYYKKQRFLFCWESRCNQLYNTNTIFWFVCCNIGLFSVLLHQKKVFFQYAASHSDFHSILLKQRFCFLLAKLLCFRIIFLRTTLFSVFLTKLHFGRSILPKKCFGLLATKLGYL